MTLIAVCQSWEQFLRATGHSMNGEGWSPNSPAKEKIFGRVTHFVQHLRVMS